MNNQKITEFQLGPLPSDSTYKVIAEKEGFIFEQVNEIIFDFAWQSETPYFVLQVEGQQGLFNTKKLASILVKVEDEADGSAPLSGKNFLGR